MVKIPKNRKLSTNFHGNIKHCLFNFQGSVILEIIKMSKAHQLNVVTCLTINNLRRPETPGDLEHNNDDNY